jgi:hypothetical protein
MKKFIVLFTTLLVLITVSLTGCSAVFHTTSLSNIVDKTYDFKDFTKIELSNSFQYDIKQADNYSVVISAPQNELDRIDIRQSGDSLIVTMKYIPFLSANPRITVTMPQLNKLAASDSCEGSAIGFNSNNNLEIDLHSSSRLNMDITAGKTTIDISGSSNISGKLTAADTNVNVTSSSRLDMALITGKTSMTFSGSSRGSGSLTAGDTAISVNSSSDINIAMKTGNASFTASGSSYIDGILSALGSDFNLTGSSHSNLQGTTGDVTIFASGSSYVNFLGLILQGADVTLQSSSHAIVNTDGALDINISGSSILDYYGHPSIGTVNVSSSSKLNRK